MHYSSTETGCRLMYVTPLLIVPGFLQGSFSLWLWEKHCCAAAHFRETGGWRRLVRLDLTSVAGHFPGLQKLSASRSVVSIEEVENRLDCECAGHMPHAMRI